MALPVALQNLSLPVIGSPMFIASGAGMEPPLTSSFKGGFWRWQPNQSMPELLLTRSEFTPDYQFCTLDKCQSLAEIMPPAATVTRLWACDKSTQPN